MGHKRSIHQDCTLRVERGFRGRVGRQIVDFLKDKARLEGYEKEYYNI